MDTPGAAPSFRATVAALALGQLVCWAALYYAFSSFVLPMQRELGWNSPQTMSAFTLGLAMWGAATYAVGAAIDRDRGRAVLTGGALLAGGGFLLWSVAHSLLVLHLAWALMGVAMAMTLYDPVFSVLTRRYADRYREGITALTLVGGFASTLSFPAVAWLIQWLEWRPALQVIGLVLIVVIAPLHAWALRGAGPQRPVGSLDAAVDHATLEQALRTPSFWFLSATFALYYFAGSAVFAHLMPALAAKGLSTAQALAIVVWFGPAQVVGRLVYLGFGRHWQPHTLGLAVLAGLPIALAIFALADPSAALLVFALLFGISNGLVTIVRGSIVPAYFGRAHVGRISGSMGAIALLARAGAPLLTAWLLVGLGGYRAMLLGLAAAGVLALLAFALAGRPPPRDLRAEGVSSA
ncbi:MAG: MFS transporter [Burkholderiaceae bacterium]